VNHVVRNVIANKAVVTQYLERVHANLDGRAHCVMHLAQMDVMGSIAKIFADAKTVANATL
jgi:hypothetical protein